MKDYNGASEEVPMAVNVKLPEALVENAKRYGAIEHRSRPSKSNTGLRSARLPPRTRIYPSSVIRDILIADQEEPVGEYRFG